jgi:hypothetical protein
MSAVVDRSSATSLDAEALMIRRTHLQRGPIPRMPSGGSDLLKKVRTTEPGLARLLGAAAACIVTDGYRVAPREHVPHTVRPPLILVRVRVMAVLHLQRQRHRSVVFPG